MTRTVPRRAGIDTTDAPAVLEAARATTTHSQVQFARRVLGANDRSYRGWLAGEPCWPPVTRLAWVIAQHPELAAEIEAAFPS